MKALGCRKKLYNCIISHYESLVCHVVVGVYLPTADGDGCERGGHLNSKTKACGARKSGEHKLKTEDRLLLHSTEQRGCISSSSRTIRGSLAPSRRLGVGSPLVILLGLPTEVAAIASDLAIGQRLLQGCLRVRRDSVKRK